MILTNWFLNIYFLLKGTRQAALEQRTRHFPMPPNKLINQLANKLTVSLIRKQCAGIVVIFTVQTVSYDQNRQPYYQHLYRNDAQPGNDEVCGEQTVISRQEH